MRKSLKTNEGITLVALVVTIIVLIILAAVSINLVLGENGILKKAQEGAENYMVASNTEQVEMENLVNYLNGDISQAPQDNRTQVAIPTLKDGEKTYTAEEQTVEVVNFNSDAITQTGDIVATEVGTYEVKWSLKDTENYKWSDGTTEEKSATWTIGKTALKNVITSANYGDSVAYSVTVEGVTLDNWKIFYNDGSSVIMVYNDYIPNATNLVAGAELIQGTGTYATYGVKSSTNRADLINKLNDTSKWTKLLNGNVNLSSKGCTAKGALDLETWIASWNAKGYQKLYTAKKTGMGDNIGWGYLVGTSEYPTTENQDLSSDLGYNDTLYFPHQDYPENCYGYWIASPSANFTNRVMVVRYCGNVDYSGFGSSNYGVCPAVYLTSDILTSGKDASGAWVIE